MLNNVCYIAKCDQVYAFRKLFNIPYTQDHEYQKCFLPKFSVMHKVKKYCEYYRFVFGKYCGKNTFEYQVLYILYSKIIDLSMSFIHKHFMFITATGSTWELATFSVNKVVPGIELKL